MVTEDTSTTRNAGRAGFTLLEVIVVLILLALAAGLAAPSLLSTRTEPASEMQALLHQARQASVRRGEMVRLTIDRSGGWRATVGAGSRREILMAGRIASPVGAVDLIFSPLGTCGVGADGSPDALAAYDFLTCEEKPS